MSAFRVLAAALGLALPLALAAPASAAPPHHRAAAPHAAAATYKVHAGRAAARPRLHLVRKSSGIHVAQHHRRSHVRRG